MRRRAVIKKRSEFTDVVSCLVQEFGDDGLVVPGSEESRRNLYSAVTTWIPLGIGDADIVMGRQDNGLPGGRIFEIYGPESHGKSTFALYLLAQTQKLGGISILFDVEQTYDEKWGKKLGINNNELVILQLTDGGEKEDPEGMEDVYKKSKKVILKIRETVPVSTPIMLVWDSVAATPTREEQLEGYNDNRPAAQARVMSPSLRKMNSFISKNNVAFVCINQIREKVGILFGDKKGTPGGKSLKFYATIRAEVIKVKTLKTCGKKSGIRCKLVNHKNKIAPPFSECFFNITTKGIEIG